MKRATPAQLCQAIELANKMVKLGILFVCVPAVDEADHLNLATQATERLERLALIAEAGE
ncbi:DUF1382 family protein, partial [Pseudomonas veronii]|nr:DUF1382 family protein [Pseudomonas veronii]